VGRSLALSAGAAAGSSIALAEGSTQAPPVLLLPPVVSDRQVTQSILQEYPHINAVAEDDLATAAQGTHNMAPTSINSSNNAVASCTCRVRAPVTVTTTDVRLTRAQATHKRIS
jgi:hypothetical protein